ncbi:FtsX-like permease family protein [Paraliobacillus ryukyuensis]|uniref:FtsX-like permease family protein n=1 Tax=Paraliobacillus ryukyuensis TaxID=200904 RepID=UPI0009A6216A|nr:FtsX-like permease family protein [Paraliobacillus ryukyuensis]
MHRLSMLQIRRNKWKSFFFFFALLLIFITIPLALNALQGVHKQVTSDITYYARGSYDLLIRPTDTQHPLEESRGIVPENYIGFGNGGISINTWKSIKNREDIEIAAPVASLGYFSGVKSTFAIYPPEHDYTRYIANFTTTDGVNTYPMTPTYMCNLLKYQTAHETYEEIINHEDLLNNCQETPSFPLPATYHLVVGIDPTEEGKLTNTSFASIAPNSKKQGIGNWYTADYPNATLIPIIEVVDGNATLAANVSIAPLDLTQQDIENFRKQVGLANSDNLSDSSLPRSFFQKFGTNEYNKVMDTLQAIETNAQQNYQLDLSSHVNAFEQSSGGLLLQKDGTVDTIEKHPELFNQGYFIDANMSASSVSYQAGPIHYNVNNGNISVKKVTERNGIPIYRELIEKGHSMKEIHQNEDLNDDDITFFLNPVDQVKIGEKSTKLASSPLGIYQFEPARFIGNKNKEAIEVEPTMTPGSYVTPSAKGLTNIDAAVAVKGEDPIDAIRVRVAGIDQYTEQAATKIEDTAEEIRSMGLDVKVVAGASPQKIEVNVEGIGLVEEAWTTLGAAGTIVSEWSITNLVLATLFVLVGCMYIFNRFVFWRITNKKDTLLLAQLGWKNKHIRSLRRRELLFILLIAAIIAIPSLISLYQLGGLTTTVYAYQLGIILATACFVWFFVNKTVKKIVNQSKSNKKKQYKRLKPKTLVGKNIYFYWSYIASSFSQLLMVSMLATFVYLAFTETVISTNATVLGQYINIQVNQWHIILVVAAYLLACMTLIEAFMSLFKTREQEIKQFLAIGWRKKDIFILYMKEITLWTGVALFIGNLISNLLFGAIYSISLTAVIIATLSFIGLYLFILLLAVIMVWHYIKRPFKK